MKNNEELLNHLIGLYFEGMTSLKQERQLRSMLADGQFRSPEAEEARAVLGVSAVMRCGSTARKSSPWITRAAAVAAVLIAAGAIVGYLNGVPAAEAPAGDCFAYVGTELVQDPDEVMGIMQAQLSDMSALADEVSRDIENNLTIIRQQ